MKIAVHEQLAPTAPSELVAPMGLVDFESIYDANVDFVHTNVRRLGISDAFADDVVQKVFLVVHKRLSEFEHRSSVRTWIFAILLRVVREEHRSIRRRMAHWNQQGNTDPDELPFADGCTSFDALSHAQACDLVQRLLDTLEPDKREVFVLAELEEMTAKQISEITGLEPSAVYSRLRAARTDFEKAAARVRRAERVAT
jgi:RNA polymerase sigma-70 factor, ECF subfamily